MNCIRYCNKQDIDSWSGIRQTKLDRAKKDFAFKEKQTVEIC